MSASAADDEDATFGALAARHRRGLKLFCMLMLGCPDAADDAVCETLLRGWTELQQGAPPASARVLLYRLATGVCLDRTDESGGPRPLDG